MPKKSKGPPSVGQSLKKELKSNQKRLLKELTKTYKDLKSIGWGVVSKGRKKLTGKAKSAVATILD